tara:strand:+ start:2659 stop:3255 length:597 start_codon:yes stop_codon:yes gene_type:complete
MNIERRLESSKEIGAWLFHCLDEIEVPNKEREVIALSLFQQSFDIADAIVILLENKLPGPAFSLARPLHECFVRATWILNHASDDKVAKFVKGKHPRFPEMLRDIGDAPETGGYWITEMTKLNIEAFHDLTHGGMEHVIRRMKDDSIEPNYAVSEIEQLLRVRNQYCINGVVYLLQLVGNEKALSELRDKQTEWVDAL